MFTECSFWGGGREGRKKTVNPELLDHPVIFEINVLEKMYSVTEELIIRDPIRTVITLQLRAKGLIRHVSQLSGNYWVLQLTG